MPITISVVTEALKELGYSDNESWLIALKVKQSHDAFEEAERLELERLEESREERNHDDHDREEYCYNQFGMSDKEYRQEMAIWNRERG